jgi:hypothetical protein
VALITLPTLALVVAACSATPATSSSTTSASTKPSTTVGSTTTTTAGPTWSSPMIVAHSTPLGAVDCPTTTLCLALDGHGNTFRFNGSTWSSAGATAIGTAGTPSLSCVGPTFCVATAMSANQVALWNGTAFAAPVGLPAQGLDAVGCATPSFCVTVDNVGDAYYFDGSSWAGRSNDWGSVAAISYPTPTFCVSAGGGISTWNGQSWTEPQPFGLTSSLTGVSCASATYCQVVDNTGQVATFTGTPWTGPQQVPPPAGSAGGSGGVNLTGVSCAAPTFCVAVTSSGAAAVWNGATWSSRTVDSGTGLTSVSCPIVAFCMAVDQKGDAVVYR